MNKKLNIFFIIFIFAISVNAEYRLGVDYKLVDNPLIIKKDGIVEVTESFWYGCNACYSFESSINAWASRQDENIKFSKMPITWGGIHQLHASLYYTIEALNLDPNTHSAVFVTIHKEGNFLQNPKQIKKFLEKFGIAPEITEQYLNSFSIKQKVNRGIKNARQLKISSVPMMIVDGKYVIEPKRSFDEMLKVVDHVIELQKPNS